MKRPAEFALDAFSKRGASRIRAWLRLMRLCPATMSGEPLAHRRGPTNYPEAMARLEAEPPVFLSLLRKGRAFPLIVAAEPHTR